MSYLEKFEFTGVEISVQFGVEVILRQIRSLVDIKRHGVKVGDIGGYLYNEDCLSHFGDAWVGEGCSVFANSTISGNTLLKDSAIVYEDCYLHGDIEVSGDATVSKSNIQGTNIFLSGTSTLEHSVIRGYDIRFEDNAYISGIETHGELKKFVVSGNAKIHRDNLNQMTFFKGRCIIIKDEAELLNVDSFMGEEVRVEGFAVLDKATVNGNRILLEDACRVTGGTTIHSNVQLSDCVTITSLFGSAISNIQLGGDLTYTTEAMGA